MNDLFNNKLHTPTWLFVLLLVVLVLRIPSFFEPYSYGDEMIYLTLGEAIRQGLTLFKDIHDNKPPLLYITAALAGSLFWFKAILAIWSLVTIFLFWKLTEALFPKKETAQKVATALFALLTTLPLLEGNIANAELFMIGPTIAAFLLLLAREHTFKHLFWAGMLFSIATLFKVPAFFDIPAILFLWLSEGKLNLAKLKTITRKTLILAIGFLAPIAATFVWYYFKGAIAEYLSAAFLQNVGYLSSWRPSDTQEPFLQKNAPLLIRGVVLLVGLLILYFKKNKLSKTFIFASVWLLLSLFAVTLSERPYPHYLVQSIPPVALLAAILITEKTFQQVLAIIPLSVFVFVPVYYKFWYYPTLSYYSKFTRFATGFIGKSEYLGTFGGHIEKSYKVADFIASRTKREDRIFVWGDTAIIYALARRLPPIKYVADYHVRDFWTKKEAAQILEGKLPQYIVTMPEAEPFPELSPVLIKNYVLVENIEGAQIWKLLSPAGRSIIAP